MRREKGKCRERNERSKREDFEEEEIEGNETETK
jgi:hypothetical protein